MLSPQPSLIEDVLDNGTVAQAQLVLPELQQQKFTFFRVVKTD